MTFIQFYIFSTFRSACLRRVARLLELVEKYISTVEESHPVSRTILPHGLSFRGEPLVLHIKVEETKMDVEIMVGEINVKSDFCF